MNIHIDIITRKMPPKKKLPVILPTITQSLKPLIPLNTHTSILSKPPAIIAISKTTSHRKKSKPEESDESDKSEESDTELSENDADTSDTDTNTDTGKNNSDDEGDDVTGIDKNKDKNSDNSDNSDDSDAPDNPDDSDDSDNSDNSDNSYNSEESGTDTKSQVSENIKLKNTKTKKISRGRGNAKKDDSDVSDVSDSDISETEDKNEDRGQYVHIDTITENIRKQKTNPNLYTSDATRTYIRVNYENQITSDRLSQFEVVELIATRISQICGNNLSTIEKPKNASVRDIAIAELAQRKCPLKIMRQVGQPFYDALIGKEFQYYEEIDPNKCSFNIVV